jgi:hypothetical protein
MELQRSNVELPCSGVEVPHSLVLATQAKEEKVKSQ